MQYEQTAELPEYEDEEKQQETVKTTKGEVRKGNYSGLHSSGFKDFVLKAELMHAIQDCGFEHPSEVQQEALPQAILGTDIICQAKSGMGKTAVFVLALLQQLSVPAEPCTVIVLGHTRELAFQIKNEFERFCRYIKGIKADVFYGGVPISGDIKRLTDAPTPIVVGTPGRILALAKKQKLAVANVKYFVMDECDKMLEQVDMRADVQAIFKLTPREKQVMMFSATMNKEIRAVCRKFVQNQVEIFIDDDTKLTLHGLQQYYVRLAEAEKNRKLVELLDALQFNQVVIFVRSVPRANELNKILIEAGFPSTAIHSGLSQDERYYLEPESLATRASRNSTSALWSPLTYSEEASI